MSILQKAQDALFNAEINSVARIDQFDYEITSDDDWNLLQQEFHDMAYVYHSNLHQVDNNSVSAYFDGVKINFIKKI